MGAWVPLEELRGALLCVSLGEEPGPCLKAALLCLGCSSFVSTSSHFHETPVVLGKFGLVVQNEVGQKLTVLPREWTGHSKYPLATTQRRLYIWTSPDGQQWHQNDYILCSQRWRGSTQTEKTRLETDCGSDHELLIAKFRLKLKKVGKTTRSFRYDLNQIPYDYRVELTNRFNGLDLIDRVTE